MKTVLAAIQLASWGFLVISSVKRETNTQTYLTTAAIGGFSGLALAVATLV